MTSPRAPVAGSTHIPLLDGLRGIAAVQVVLRHLGYDGLMPHALPVDFFFLLSGYVMARAYEHKFDAGLGFATFAKVRLIRLYPVILIGAALMLAVVLLGFKTVEGDLLLLALAQFAMIPVFAPGMDIFRISGVQWPLLFELLANAVHRLVYPWLTNATLVALCAASLAGLLAAALVFPSFTLGWGGDNAWVGVPRVGFSYFAGVLLFQLTRRRTLPQVPAWLILIGFAALAFVPHILGVPVNAVRFGILVVVFPAVVLASIGARMGQVSSAVCLMFGELSYPLYATHHAVLFPAERLFAGVAGPERLAIDAGVLACMLALAFAVSRLWDRPVRAWLNRRPRAAYPVSAE